MVQLGHLYGDLPDSFYLDSFHKVQIVFDNDLPLGIERNLNDKNQILALIMG
jgi:hypothetical protein